LTVSDLTAEVGAETGVRFSAEVVTTLAELAVDKNQRTAQDLEAFAQHAKRSNITGEDVKLLTRRNPHLTSQLSSISSLQPARGRPSNKAAKSRAKQRDGDLGPGGSGTGGRPLID